MHEQPDKQYFQGFAFSRNPKGYYQNRKLNTYIHRAIYEYHKGRIPEGFEIHHKNGDKSDNRIDNLEAKRSGEHQEHHWAINREELLAIVKKNLVNASERAKPWHSSEAGRKWHSEHRRSIPDSSFQRSFSCLICGKEFSAYAGGYNKLCSRECKMIRRNEMARRRYRESRQASE